MRVAAWPVILLGLLAGSEIVRRGEGPLMGDLRRASGVLRCA